MEELILIGTIILIVSIIRKSYNKRNKARRVKQIVTRQQIPIVSGQDFSKLIKAEQKELDKLKKEDLKRKEQIRTAKQKARIAWNDMQHYKQQQTDYMRLYNYYDRIANDNDINDKKRIAAYTRCINLDNKIRTINRNIETAQNKIDNFYRLNK